MARTRRGASAVMRRSTDRARFVESEVALDAALHELLLLTQNAAEFYPELVRLNVAASLIDLLNRPSRSPDAP